MKLKVLKNLNRPQRKALTHEGMAGLVFLAIERKIKEKINVDKLLQIFYNTTNQFHVCK